VAATKNIIFNQKSGFSLIEN